MISYNFILAPDQPLNKDPLYQLQACLASADIFLDLSWKDDTLQMTISISEDLLEKVTAKETDQSNVEGEDSTEAELPREIKRRGRPAAKPKNDLTLGRVYHMRFLGVPAETIAEDIGVSRRTFYRRLALINGKNLSEDTPFSKWV